MKVILSSSPILAIPNYTRPFVVFLDACIVAVGAVLIQEQDIRRYHPVHYVNRYISKEEKRYSTFEQEALAVIFLPKTFRHYLLSEPFVVHSNHEALRAHSRRKISMGAYLRGFNS